MVIKLCTGVSSSKYTEVGYVGRDVDAMVRDLVEAAVRVVRAEKVEAVDPTGAGDALCAGLIKALIDDGVSPGQLSALEAERLTTLMLRGQAAGAACVT